MTCVGQWFAIIGNVCDKKVQYLAMELIITQSQHHFPAFPHLLKMSRQYRSSEKGRKMMRGEMIWKLEGSLCAWECNEGEELI